MFVQAFLHSSIYKKMAWIKQFFSLLDWSHTVAYNHGLLWRFSCGNIGKKMYALTVTDFPPQFIRRAYEAGMSNIKWEIVQILSKVRKLYDEIYISSNLFFYSVDV